MRPPPDRSDEGFILVVVLVLLMALATLASIYSVYAGDAAVKSLVPEDRVRAEEAIRSGVEVAALELLRHEEAQRPSHGEAKALLGEIRVNVTYRTESARVDLNLAPREFLSGLFAELGLPTGAADSLAGHVMAWRSKPTPNLDDPEPTAYREAGLAYSPREAPFNSVLELGLVLGMPPALMTRAASYLTIYSGHPQVDVAEADPLIIAAMPGLRKEALSKILDARASGADAKALTGLMGAAAENAIDTPGSTYRAKIDVILRSRRIRADVVFMLVDDAPNPYEILYWKDDFDAASPAS